MTRIDEDTDTPWFKEPALLSYKECKPESNDIMLFYDGEYKGTIEVWTDRSHESRMETGTAEYIILNHTMYYIDDWLTKWPSTWTKEMCSNIWRLWSENDMIEPMKEIVNQAAMADVIWASPPCNDYEIDKN
jgi:hypothetical protein